ncbi:hypothetical protein GIB67_000188 [Kingdonia uniflora]|uniref:SKP1 component POZ domain-containing protein n=1 Tax=Kingdonia uniflora TaxID=39325 RepID=A0A7J7PAD0_9MAGN|nr:hypothetical protein GIB67_000188 [Kingdonia uniflora]
MSGPSLSSLSSSSSSSSRSEELFQRQIEMMYEYSKVMIEMGEAEEKEQKVTSSRRRGGSKMGRIDKRKGRNHKLGEFSRNRNYFGANPVCTGILFRRRFCMSEVMSRMFTLKSFDGESFEIKEVVAVQSKAIECLIEDDCANNAIPLPNVASNILAKVIEYCKKLVGSSDGNTTEVDEDLKT